MRLSEEFLCFPRPPQQHVADLERALGNAEAAQAQLRAELDDQAQSEQRLIEALVRQCSPLREAMADLQRTLHDVTDRQHAAHSALDTINSRCGDLAREMDQMQDAIAGVQVEVQERTAALSRSVDAALEQTSVIQNQFTPDRTALQRCLTFEHLATMRAVRTGLARSEDRTIVACKQRGKWLNA